MESALLERFRSKYKVNEVTGCWEWQHATNGKAGYGICWDGKKRAYAHRWIYEQTVAEIPEGMVIDHLCRTPACVNTDHMEVVTHKENILRSDAPTAINITKTHCPQGHPYSEENTYHPPSRPSWRRCRQCAYDTNKRVREEKKQ